MFAGFAPTYLFWVPLLPVLFAVWVLRERTTVDDDGIGARYLLRRSASVTWADFRSIRFARNGRGYAVRADGTRFRLPGVSFNSLVTLSEATHGRIPDPVTPGRAEAEGKVQVVNKDGYAVRADGTRFRLPGVSFNSLVTLSEATHGRIPDPVTPRSTPRARPPGPCTAPHTRGHRHHVRPDTPRDHDGPPPHEGPRVPLGGHDPGPQRRRRAVPVARHGHDRRRLRQADHRHRELLHPVRPRPRAPQERR
ncbi:PH domain-containing protein [Corynebacterium bovis]